MSNPSEQIFTWEGITLPSYYGGALAAPTALTAMSQITATGAGTMTIIPNFFQANQFSNDPALKLDPNNPWGSESDTFAQVKAAILEVKSRGLNVVLKPHLETNNRVWRAEIAPSDPKAWFDNYQNMMVEYAKVAQSAGAAMFCVGTEMVSMTDPTKSFFDASTGTTKTYTQRWGELIAAVKAVYSGPVTYAATYEETTKVRFWDKVDYIGVDAYLPMSAIDNPTVDQMVDAWIKPHFNSWIRDTLHGGKSAVDYYKSLSEQYGKQILFTEVGFRSADGANKDPGNFNLGTVYDPREQVDAYTALYKVMENYGGRWLGGAFLWSWLSFADPMAEKDVPWTDYTPQHKPAYDTITAHYSGPDHGTGIVWNGTAAADKIDGGYHNDTLNGAGGNDTLWGGGGTDLIGGNGGSDRLVGGAGDDVYEINDSGDTVVEDPGPSSGSDTVRSTIDYQLGANVEHLQLVGSTAHDGTGNALANRLTGNDEDNVLEGGAGNDTIDGGGGSNVAVFSAARTQYAISHSGNGGYAVAGPDGIDQIRNIQFLKFAGQLQTIGSAAPNAPPDSLVLSKSSVSEDTLVTTIVAGLAAHDADGDDVSYSLVDGGGFFTLDGSNLLLAKALDYETKTQHIVTIEAKDGYGGVLRQSFTIQVSDVAETPATPTTPTDPTNPGSPSTPSVPQPLTLIGTPGIDTLTGASANDVIKGMAGKDTLVGNAGNDKLYGGLGNDMLTGGSGQDIFLFDTALGRTNVANKRANLDKITDFVVADDTIHLAKSVFKAVGKKGVLKQAAFYSGSHAHDADDRIIFDKKTGALFYDSDGNGDTAAIQFATLSKNLKGMSFRDFFVT